MDVLDLLDRVQVHALAAATAAGGATFTDVQVGFPAAKGRCVRIFYGGEREPEHFDGDPLDSRLMGQAVVVRGYWPTPETAAKRSRVIEAEMAVFVKQLRTRVLADADLGGESKDLEMAPSIASQTVIAKTQYAITDTEIVVDFDEYPKAP